MLILLNIWDIVNISELYESFTWVIIILVTLGTIISPLINMLIKKNSKNQ